MLKKSTENIIQLRFLLYGIFFWCKWLIDIDRENTTVKYHLRQGSGQKMSTSDV